MSPLAAPFAADEDHADPAPAPSPDPAPAPSPDPAPVPAADELIAVDAYPGIALDHAFVADADGRPVLRLTLALRTAAYRPDPEGDGAAAREAARVDADAYARADVQARSGASFAVATTLVPASRDTPSAIDAASIASFTAAAHAYLVGIAQRDDAALGVDEDPFTTAPRETVDVALPAVPGPVTTVAPLRVELTVSRAEPVKPDEPVKPVNADEPVDPDTPDGEVTPAPGPPETRTSPVPARGADDPSGYVAYAAALEAACGGGLRVAVDDDGDLHVVRIGEAAPSGSAAIRSVTTQGAPSCFALPPLSRGLVSRTVDVRDYVPSAAVPLPGPGRPHAFTAVDVERWASEAFALIDLACARECVDAAQALGAEPSGLLVARRFLAERIAARVVPVADADADAPAGELPAARDGFRRILGECLTAGWSASALVQQPVAVAASFGEEGAVAHTHRLRVAAPPEPPVDAADPRGSGGDDGEVRAPDATPGTIALDAAAGRLEIVVAPSEPARRRDVRLDLRLDATGLDRVAPPPRPGAPATTTHLRFVTPPSDGDPIPALEVGRDVPVALRVVPPAPGMAGQSAEPATGDVIPATLEDALTWSFRADVEVALAAQDELWITVDSGDAVDQDAPAPGPTTPPSARAPTAASDPFGPLAELTFHHGALRADLELLARSPTELAADPGARVRAVAAWHAVAGLAEQLAATWGPIDDGFGLAGRAGGVDVDAVATLRVETVVVHDSGGRGTLAELVVHRAPGTAWGPDDRKPRLGIRVEGHDDPFVLRPGATDDVDALRYVVDPARRPTVDDRWTLTVGYADLHAVTTPGLRTAAWSVRNARIGLGAAATAAFAMRTAVVRFADAARPHLHHGDPIAIGGGSPAGLADALASTFRTVLGPDPARRGARLALSVRYASRLVPDTDPGGPGFETLMPVLYVPSTTDVAALPTEIAAEVATWIAERRPPADDARVALELQVFSDADPSDVPLAVLDRLDYRLTPRPTPEGPIS